jgi:hypothetical protein
MMKTANFKLTVLFKCIYIRMKQKMSNFEIGKRQYRGCWSGVCAEETCYYPTWVAKELWEKHPKVVLAKRGRNSHLEQTC